MFLNIFYTVLFLLKTTKKKCLKIKSQNSFNSSLHDELYLALLLNDFCIAPITWKLKKKCKQNCCSSVGPFAATSPSLSGLYRKLHIFVLLFLVIFKTLFISFIVLQYIGFTVHYLIRLIGLSYSKITILTHAMIF